MTKKPKKLNKKVSSTGNEGVKINKFLDKCPFLEHLIFCTNKKHYNSLGRPKKVLCAYPDHNKCPFFIHSQSLAKDAPEPLKIETRTVSKPISITKLAFMANKESACS